MAATAELVRNADPNPRVAAWAIEGAQQPEQRKSFDVMASVRMFQYDRRNYGRVLPETRQRVRDEELSLLSEGVDRAARTTFALKRIDNDLTYFSKGQWRPYTGMLLGGREVAEAEAAADPRKQFLFEAAVRDLEKGYQMRGLQPGQQLVWASPYRKDLESLYGAKFMRDCGHNPGRQMGFLYRAYCTDSGDVILQSQTVDGGDLDAISAALRSAEHNPEADMGEMVEAHDAVMVHKHGGEFYAGRRGADIEENAWSLIMAEEDLVNYFLDKLESLSGSGLDNAHLEQTVKEHVYGVWAAFKKRLDGKSDRPASGSGAMGRGGIIRNMLLEQEVNRAFTQFVHEGQVQIFCGGAISVLKNSNDIMNASSEDIFKLIFGQDLDEDKYGSLSFTCPVGHVNWRKRNQLLPECLRCGTSVAC